MLPGWHRTPRPARGVPRSGRLGCRLLLIRGDEPGQLIAGGVEAPGLGIHLVADLGDALHERPAFPGDRTRIPRAGKDAGDEFGRESQLEQRADRDDGTHSGIVELAVPVGAALRLQQPGLLVVADRPWARTGLATELSDSHGIPPSDLTLTSA